MRKFGSILNKEFLLLFRDIPGLIILFLMPVLLIFVVTLAQEKALSGQQSRTKILFADEINNPFSAGLLASLDSSGFFEPVTRIKGNSVDAKTAAELIRQGEFSFGIVLPRADTTIILLIDPTLQDSYKTTVINSLTYLVRGTQSKGAMDGILESLPANMKTVIAATVAESLRKLPPIKQEYALKDRSEIRPGVIQNNVPGFILFAMFFIVIPLAGSLITEKNEGSFRRLLSLPVTLTGILGGKVVAYLAVCLIQFMLMISIGIWVFPALFGFPPLEIGTGYAAIALATIAASLAAIGFGIIVGATASTHNQAALFGSVMVVLLGVISGTFLPIHLMPSAIRFISHLSPIRWGIDNYLDIFIREAGFIGILPNTLLLLLFFILAMIVSISIFARRN